MSDRKHEDPKPIGAVLAEIGIGTPKWLTKTDEEWAEQDARAAQFKTTLHQEPERDLVALDWPERAVRVARQADVTTGAAQRIAQHDFGEQCVLVLSGSPGVGKTVAAAIWALGCRWSVRFVRASTFAAASRYDAEKRERWFNARALVLDDLGAEYLDTKGSFLVDLDELVDTYYGGERPLVITTNLGGEDFARRYGSRVRDRLRECGRWASVAGESMRRKPEARHG